MTEQKKKNPVGRPTKMTQPTLEKLETAFSFGCTNEEACLYAGIDHSTLALYEKKHPEFYERKLLLKRKPMMKARITVVKSLEDVEQAKWYLEHKSKGEFSKKQTVEHEGLDKVPVVLIDAGKNPYADDEGTEADEDRDGPEQPDSDKDPAS